MDGDLDRPYVEKGRVVLIHIATTAPTGPGGTRRKKTHTREKGKGFHLGELRIRVRACARILLIFTIWSTA